MPVVDLRELVPKGCQAAAVSRDYAADNNPERYAVQRINAVCGSRNFPELADKYPIGWADRVLTATDGLAADMGHLVTAACASCPNNPNNRLGETDSLDESIIAAVPGAEAPAAYSAVVAVNPSLSRSGILPD